ncbi:YdcF family protein [Salmonirosea aquatica]|uniref:YdcF family protein n=1 Tax=Salmonirosea aquatica TaxID=2654236 RepID=A0A7C9F2R6_9BACT|nr:YdcF family protein [Cytophagaceae bacterium SJW1-29]
MSQFLKATPICLLFLALSLGLSAQKPGPLATYEPIYGPSVVQLKNFYALSLLESPDASRILLADPALRSLYQQKNDHLSRAVKECGSDVGCYTGTMKFTEDEIKLVSGRLSQLYKADNGLGKLVKDHLIPSGTYILYDSLPLGELLVKAWELEARGLNHVLEVYAEGMKPNYPAIDSIAFNTKSRSFGTLAYDVAELTRQEGNTSLFFSPSLQYALRWLEVNGRDEAADYEPMRFTENKAAFLHARALDSLAAWDKFKYSVILVPGSGPSDPSVALSPVGMLRCRLGALRYFDGLAPFLVVSGGRVHPFKTKYSEAFEMKRYLMEVLHVPEEAIVLEPHARHTTTNLRNTVRLLFHYGMPIGKPCLITTTRSQSLSIGSHAFVERCRRELGYLPYRLGERLSDTDLEFFPSLNSLQIDHDEPLDP